MVNDHRERLRSIRTFPALVKYLRKDLDWPIQDEPFEELVFDYTPEELGIDPKNAAKIDYIKRFRPLVPNQPWGIFFVMFEPKRLPVVALRRMLNQLINKKRASSDREGWETDDLLFISNYGETDHRQITFVNFSNSKKGALADLKVLGWDDQDTALHLDHTAKTLKQQLSWSDHYENNFDAWRKSWQGAFTLLHRESITTSLDLAVNLAELAKTIRKRLNSALEVETSDGPLRKLMKAFQTMLIHDLTNSDFADMYAQTIAYGLLSARIAKRTGGGDDLAESIPVTNPFLKELLETFLNTSNNGSSFQGISLDFDELGVNEVVEALDRSNMEAIIRDFGDRNPQEDPVIHFYELFLEEYDKKQKVQRGVFYTPRPVVSYIVRSVDDLLRTEFGLEDGLADTASWGDMTARFENLEIPKGVPSCQSFVQILDPATGTGTFLIEVIDVIHKTMVEKWQSQNLPSNKIKLLWNEYVPNHLLPRLHGYELLMAPYAIAHMKIGLKLHETGYLFGNDKRARVYLTNSLEPASDQQLKMDFLPALSREAQTVNEIKRNQRFTVVIGNPPYSVLSSNLSSAVRSIVDPYRYIDGHKIKERSMLRLEMHLQDDYVKFMALGQQLIERTDVGVLSMITNSGYLDNLTLRGVRFALLKQFDYLDVTNLHGSQSRQSTTLTSELDENVFDITQGVSVLVGAIVKHFSGNGRRSYIDIIGERSSKTRMLSGGTQSSGSKSLSPRSPNFFLVPKDDTGWDEYEQFTSLTDVMPVNISGIVTAHDRLVIDFDDDRLNENFQVLSDTTIGNDEAREMLKVKDNSGWKLRKAREEIQALGNSNKYNKDYAYRPFDTRRVLYHPAVIWSDRRNVMSHVMNGNNMAIATCRQLAAGPWEHVFITRFLQDDCFISNRSRERSYHFPIELRGSGRQRGDQAQLFGFDSEIRPNLSRSFQSALESALRSSSRDTRLSGDKLSEMVPPYIYAVLHSRNYRTRYSEFLKIDFPRIPLPSSIDLFQTLTQFGTELIDLHLMESPKLEQFITVYEGNKLPVVGTVGWSNETVWLDAGKTDARRGHRSTKLGTNGFIGVTEQVWDFRIGAYQVCHKWLKDRKGRTLSSDDLGHYQKIIIILSETIRIKEAIDEVIDQHGGWPEAFQAS